VDVGKFFGSLFGTASGAAVSRVSGAIDGAKQILGMFKLDPTVKAQLDAQLTEANLDQQKAEMASTLAAMQGQLDINKQEAASTSLFIAGWRPAVGWVCVAALAYAYVFEPFLKFILAIRHPDLMAHLPVLDTGTLLGTLLIPLLGLGAMRTYEKVKAPDVNHGGKAAG